MKYFFVLAVLTVFSIPAFPQSVCDMTVADLVEIHGLKLGISRREVEKVYTETPTTINVQRTVDLADHGRLEGIWFDYYSDSLAAVEFDYDRTGKWNDVHGFAFVLGQTLKLPERSWVFIDRTEAVMKCRDFNIAISTIRNTLTLTDTFAKAAAKENESRNAFRQRKRIYKP